MGYHQAASQMNRVLLVLKACGAESGVGGGQIREERCILDADTGLVIRSHRVGRSGLHSDRLRSGCYRWR